MGPWVGKRGMVEGSARVSCLDRFFLCFFLGWRTVKSEKFWSFILFLSFFTSCFSCLLFDVFFNWNFKNYSHAHAWMILGWVQDGFLHFTFGSVDLVSDKPNTKSLRGYEKNHPFVHPSKKKLQYCWWLKSCTTWDVWNPINNGIFFISTGAGFLPSTVPFSNTKTPSTGWSHQVWSHGSRRKAAVRRRWPPCWRGPLSEIFRNGESPVVFFQCFAGMVTIWDHLGIWESSDFNKKQNSEQLVC